MIHLKTILHPTDFSEDSRYALEVACALARDQAARVILLHVLPAPAGPGEAPTVRALHAEEDLRAYREEMARELEKVRAAAPPAKVEPVLKEGEVAAVIARTAAETPCDLIVIGTRGRNGGPAGQMGGVARAVSRAATCPVVTVRAPVKVPPAGP